MGDFAADLGRIVELATADPLASRPGLRDLRSVAEAEVGLPRP